MLASCGARKFNAAGHNSAGIADKEKPRMSGAFFSAARKRSIRTVVNAKDVNNYSLARQGKHSHRLSLVERKHLLVSPECRRGYRLLRPALSYWKQPNVYRWAETKLHHNPSNR